jgi:hypothetical protein
MTEKWTSPNIREAYLAALENSETEGGETTHELIFVSSARSAEEGEAGSHRSAKPAGRLGHLDAQMDGLE